MCLGQVFHIGRKLYIYSIRLKVITPLASRLTVGLQKSGKMSGGRWRTRRYGHTNVAQVRTGFLDTSGERLLAFADPNTRIVELHGMHVSF